MRFLATASALVVAAAVPALAADVTVPVAEQFPEEYFEGNKAAGYVDLHYGWLWDGQPGMGQAPQWQVAGIAGRANLPFSPSSPFNLQLDGTASTRFDSDYFSLATPIEATAHLYYRDPSRYAVGVLGSYGIVGGQNLRGAGAEGQIFLNRVTLYGQGGYRWQDTPAGVFNEWYVRAVGRYFPSDNIRLEGEIGFAQFDYGSPYKLNNLFWSATAEYRFGHMPLGVYAQYRGGQYDYGEDELGVITAQAAVLGVRAHLGSDSLFGNDRRGASFDTRAPDPTVYQLQQQKPDN